MGGGFGASVVADSSASVMALIPESVVCGAVVDGPLSVVSLVHALMIVIPLTTNAMVARLPNMRRG